jgi:hypothetical protein
MSVPAALRRVVWERAESRCEYCRMSQDLDPATFEVDHVAPEKMEGETAEANLCLACFKCNNHKGPNIAGIDPDTSQKTFLFDLRNDGWAEHFLWQGPLLRGKTPEGRTTIALLQINLGHRVAHRRPLIGEGVFPPAE